MGVKDSWNGNPKSATPKANYVFHTKKQALGLLSDLKILEFIEEDEDGKTILGVKKTLARFLFYYPEKIIIIP